MFYGGRLGGELGRSVLQFFQHSLHDVLGMRLFHAGYHVNSRLRRLALSDDARTYLHGLLHSRRSGLFLSYNAPLVRNR